MPKNIWIHAGGLLFGYIGSAIRSLIFIFVHAKFPKNPTNHSITHELISVGPESFARYPRAIRLGRALFIPLLLISQLYDRKILNQK